ncbi:nicotinate-nucleotide--dimethylbenzimidazole phosphoribosyltransferase [Streptomyces sp. NPDC050997]|uniref:nicotinate-nucleotide--dimethylbenzimidazole phosphoribosyltransferase n=1 Tax=Streptomyces sp. NPDC050997 TaxID=3155519 RepID=UPI0034469551
MTDTGQVPADGLPENAGMVDQPGASAHGAYTYLSETTAEDEDLLLLPGAQGAWGNEVPPPAPEPVVETVHEPGPHEISGRDSGSVDLSAVRLPHSMPVPPVVPAPPRRPLHLGPPIPDASASPVRSLADRGAVRAPVRQSGPVTTGPEYLDVPQSREMSPQGAAPWGASASPQDGVQGAVQAPVSTEAPAAETVVPVEEHPAEPVATAEAAEGAEVPAAAQTAVAGLATEAVAATAPQGAQAGQPLQSVATGAGPQFAEAGVAAPGQEAGFDPQVPQGGEASQVGDASYADGGDPAAQVWDAGQPAHDAQVPDAAQWPEGAQVVEGDQPAATASVSDAEQLPEAAPVVGADPDSAAGAVTDAGEVSDGAPDAKAEQSAVAAVDDGQVPGAEAGIDAGAVPGTAAVPEVEQDAEGVGSDVGNGAGNGVGPDAGELVADAVGPYAEQLPEGAPAPVASEQGAENPHVSVVDGAPVSEGDASDIAPDTDLVPDTDLAPSAETGVLDPAAQEPGAPEPGFTEPAIVDSGAPGDGSAVDAGQLPETLPVPDAAQTPHTESTPDSADVPGAVSVPDAVPAPSADPLPEAEPLPDAEQIPAAAAPVPVADQIPEAVDPGDHSAVPEAVPFPAAEDVSANPQFVAATSAPLPHAEGVAAVHPDPSQQQAVAEQAVAEPGQAPTPDAPQVQGPQIAPDPTLAQDTEPAPAAFVNDPATTPVPDAEYTPAPHDESAPLPDALAAHGEDIPGPQPLQPATEPQPDQSLGQFVAVEGSVPTAPHLPPTPPHAMTLPPEDPSAPRPVAAVPAPRDGDPGLVQRAEDLDTRAADQEDREDQQEQQDQQGQEESTAAVEDVRQSTGPAAPAYDDAEREAVLKVMRERRDIRNGFRGDPIPHEVLLRVLEAAHTAPSVGHSQPWDFVVIRSADTRRAMHELAMRQRDAYAKSLPKGRAKQFKELKIEAILDTPVNIVVTADPTRGGRHTLGRHTQPQMAPYSAALAVENLWLAARAEGLGVGWVSFFDEREMVRALGLPEHLEVIAYLCVGYVDEFPDEPELLQAGWSKRRPLSWVVHEETYGRRALPGEEPHDLLGETVAQIRPLDAKALGEAWERQKRMTKPAGALGMLEIISAQLSGLSRQCPPPIPEPAAVAIFAGDHGVHAQGVTPWPQEVTAQMVANFLGGGAVCNAFASQVGAEVCVVDVGVATDLPATPGLLPRKIRAGTSDMTTGPAMTREEAKQAIEVGIETARDLVAAGNKALLTGEMGIANTTASAALISVFTGADPAEVTGRGTGINDETLARKTEVVRRALDLHQPDPADPVGVLAAIGGFEHAAMVGLLLGGASLRTPVILDGVSAGAAALVARAIAPEVLAACIAGHRSAEPGHVAALNKLGLRPLVDLDLRLGEGTGALLALPLVQSTARAMHEVATFDSAGVTEK